MKQTSKQWVSDFLIFSSFSIERIGLIESLLYETKQAYFARDKARTKLLGERLANVSPRLEHLGRWYLSLSAPAEKWSQNSDELTKELESLINEASLSVRAAAMSSLAAKEIRSNTVTSATKQLLIESSALSLRTGDTLNFIQTQSQISLLCSIDGDHKGSLRILRGLQPAVDKIGSLYGALKSDFYNSVACELLQIGNIDAATYYINFVLKSPHLSAYPEWKETAIEIAQSIPAKNQLQIFVPHHKPDNVVDNEEFQALKEKKAQRESVQTEEQDYKYPCIVVHVEDDKFAIMHLSGNRGMAGKTIQIYGLSLEELTSRWGDKGTLIIKSFFCHKKEVRLLSEDKILPAHLSHLNGLLEDLAMLPESLFYDTIDNNRASDEEVDRIWDYVAPMVNENSK